MNKFFKVWASIKSERVGVEFLSIFGLIWLFLEPGGLFLPQWFDWGLSGYIGLFMTSLVIAIIRNLPKSLVSLRTLTSDTVIEIKVGDLFKEHNHIVVGTNDTFDTELGEVIKTSSVQGQLLTKLYYEDQQRLDVDIDTALTSLKPVRILDSNKARGKRWRYPIGTTLALGSSNRRYFLCAYGRMGNNLKVKTTTSDLWCSLNHLWEAVREKGHGLEVAMPIVGSDLARTNLSRMMLIRIIILSFITASQQDFITKKLTLIIYHQDVDSIDIPAIESFLSSVCV